MRPGASEGMPGEVGVGEIYLEYFLTSERYLKFKSEGRFDGSAEARSYMKTLSEDINNLLKIFRSLNKIHLYKNKNSHQKPQNHSHSMPQTANYRLKTV